MKHRLVTLCLHVAVFFLLLFGYEEYVVPIYGYEGYIFEPNPDNWHAALASVVMLSLVTPIAYQKPSTVFHQLTLTTVVIPMMVLFYTENQPWEYVAQVLIAYLLSIALPFLLKITPPKFSVIPRHKLRIVLFSVAYLYIAAIFLMGGGSYLNFDFSKIYDLRHEASDNLPGMFGYISPMVSQVAVPMGFVLSLLYKKYVMAFLLLVSAVLIFGLTTHKATLFTPLMLFFIYFVSLNKNLIFKFNLGVLAVVLAAIADFWLWKNYDPDFFGWIGTLMLARVFFLPAQLNYMYYDFFSKNDLVWFSDSKITLGLVDYKYPLDVTHLIGLEYFNSEKTGANTGWLGSGYMQGGFFGLCLYAIIIAAIFKYIDACARNSGERALITAMLVVPVSTLISSADFPTTMLTHGLFVSLLLITCFRRSDSFNVHRVPHAAVRATAPGFG